MSSTLIRLLSAARLRVSGVSRVSRVTTVVLVLTGLALIPGSRASAAAGDVTTYAGTTTGYADGPAASAKFGQLPGIAFGPSGTMYLADAGNNRIRRIDASGNVTTFSGSGTAGHVDGPAGTARFNLPFAILVDGDENLYVSEVTNNDVRKVAPDGSVTTLVSGLSGPHGLTFDSSGRLLIADTFDEVVSRFEADGSLTVVAGQQGTPGYADGPAGWNLLNHPKGVAVDSSDNIIVTDSGNNLVRTIAPDGTVGTLAGSTGVGTADGPSWAMST